MNMLPVYAGRLSSSKILQTYYALRQKFSNLTGFVNAPCQFEKLNTRGLIRVRGADVTPYLQGIVTNDMKHLQACPSMFAMFLNTKGRVLYDAIVYRQEDDNTLLIECDQQSLDDLVKHLKIYRVRRKIDVDSIDGELKLWVAFNPDVGLSFETTKSIKQEQIVPCASPVNVGKDPSYFDEITLGDGIRIYSDPRIPELGKRIIAPGNVDVKKCMISAGVKVITSPLSYRMFRYRLGVGEGIQELPIGKCFPLEANCDYLHGVSFHKGCYIGQELTARTHHTGVVRKRLMPLLLQSAIAACDFTVDLPIERTSGESKKAIGKLRGVEKDCGLGLMRVAEALDVRSFKVGAIEAETARPFWWPQELPKERIDTGTK